MEEIIKKLLADGKGLGAMDASNPTMEKRMGALGIVSTPESRCNFRELLVTTPGLGNYISGAILYDETIHQKLSDGRTFVQALNDAGIIPGIKTDTGLVELPCFPEEKVAQGLDNLGERLSGYKKMGVKFTKFRTVAKIGRDIPTRICMEDNAFIMALQTSITQSIGLVPVIEPEVLMDGDHNLERCEEVTRTNLKVVFVKLADHKVDLSKMILKPN
ncbi:MAG: fructose-bisphosphate aldolase class I, partial [Candidatus Woesebacteria bacterium]|nr:fructose-bisphosphate aldolase class I [Candidatus Woesebacteria bacterium]